MQFCIIFVSLLKQRFPFNVGNPVGYVIAFAIQYVLVSNNLLSPACVTAFSIGISSTMVSFTKDINDHLYSINQKVKLKKNLLHILKQFTGLIELHGNAIQLSECDKLGR